MIGEPLQSQASYLVNGETLIRSFRIFDCFSFIFSGLSEAFGRKLASGLDKKNRGFSRDLNPKQESYPYIDFICHWFTKISKINSKFSSFLSMVDELNLRLTSHLNQLNYIWYNSGLDRSYPQRYGSHKGLKPRCNESTAPFQSTNNILWLEP